MQSNEGGNGVDNRMALITVKQPGPVKHQSAVSAYQHLTSGRIVAGYGGLLFIPDAARESPWHLKDEPLFLDKFPDGPFSQEELEEARVFLERE